MAFQFLPSLTTLNLSNNKLQRLDDITEIIAADKLFQNLPKLENLDLSHNELYYIHPDTFNSLSKLKNLDLSHNKLNHIHHDTFNSLSKLGKLHLSHNELNLIHHDTFNSLTNITALFLDENKLERIAPNTFKNQCRLKLLSLKNNQFGSVARDTFEGANLLNLEHIFLDDNPISLIHRYAFDPVHKLRSLSIITDPKETHIDASVAVMKYLRHSHLRSFEIKVNENINQPLITHHNIAAKTSLENEESTYLNGIERVTQYLAKEIQGSDTEILAAQAFLKFKEEEADTSVVAFKAYATTFIQRHQSNV